MQVHSTRLSHKMTFNPSKDKTKHTEKPDNNNNNNSSYFSKAKNIYVYYMAYTLMHKKDVNKKLTAYPNNTCLL